MATAIDWLAIAQKLAAFERQGEWAKKFCWWLNRPYALEIVNAHLR